MEEQIGMAIVGCGGIAPVHADAVQELEHVHLQAVVDSDQPKARQMATAYGCNAWSDYRVLLERDDIQAVHLCTPHHLHADMAARLLRAGKHVLTEKPMAHNLEAAEKLLATAQQCSTQLGVCFQNRYNLPSRQICEIIDNGTLGRLLCLKGIVTWHREASYYTDSPWRGRWATEGGGVLINQAIHTLDLLRWFGGEVVSVQGSATADVLEETIEVEDTAHASIEFVGGVRGLFYATNAYLTNSPVELELVFEDGTLYQRRDCLFLYRDGQEIQLAEPPSGPEEPNPVRGKPYWGSSHRKLIADFYEHIRSGTPFPLDGIEGCKTLQLIEQIYRSSRTRVSR
ncbi:Gfo/Idh/MocA family protein [Paenibacillus sanguinis]|uniref:Gfo/Idh/MocA family protein n=1 Tax=Paenibacillus sanguinis TaxID=225906 RepID=UPI00036A3181|nr:Gfo/Idh/MocA family oxidoreductase [Paenibacillus sanguinis]